KKVLRELPVELFEEKLDVLWDKEAQKAFLWDNEAQIVRRHPDLILIHRSAFFHAYNALFKFGVADEGWKQTYDIAEDKLLSVIGFVGTFDSRTKFLV